MASEGVLCPYWHGRIDSAHVKELLHRYICLYGLFYEVV